MTANDPSLTVGTNSKQKHKFALLALSLVVIGVIGILGKALQMNPAQIPSALIGKPAFDFDVKVIQGSQWLSDGSLARINQTSFKGKPLIVNFWASWCMACRDEARDFEAFWQEYKSKGINLLGIAIQDEPSAALEFARTFGKTYLLGIDDNGQSAINYGVTGVPETFFIDSRGIIRDKITGPADPAKLREIVEKLLAQPQ